MPHAQGPAHVTDVNRSRGPGTGRVYPAWVYASRLVALPLMAVVGGASVWSSRAEPYLAPFGLLLLGLVALGVATTTLELRWARGRPGPALGVDPSGTPSTLLARAPWSTPLRWGLTATLAVPLALWLLLALLDGQWVWTAALGAALVYVVVTVTPRGPSQGLHLAPHGLTLDDHGRRRVLPWSELAAAVPVGRPFLRRRDGSRVQFVAMDLAVHPYLVCLAIQTCIDEPDRRAELGTPASLTWLVWNVDL